jgi:hypothetical protein
MAARNELIKMSLTERYQQLDGYHLCTPFTLTLIALGIVAVAALVISGAAFLASGLPPPTPPTSPPRPPLDSLLDRAGGWRADTSTGADPGAVPQSLNRHFYGARASASPPPFLRSHGSLHQHISNAHPIPFHHCHHSHCLRRLLRALLLLLTAPCFLLLLLLLLLLPSFPLPPPPPPLLTLTLSAGRYGRQLRPCRHGAPRCFAGRRPCGKPPHTHKQTHCSLLSSFFIFFSLSLLRPSGPLSLRFSFHALFPFIPLTHSHSLSLPRLSPSLTPHPLPPSITLSPTLPPSPSLSSSPSLAPSHPGAAVFCGEGVLARGVRVEEQGWGRG